MRRPRVDPRLEVVMRARLPFFVLSAALLLSVAPTVGQDPAGAQASGSPALNTCDFRADDVLARARDLYAQPDRATMAARLHIESARLSSAGDPAAIQSLVLGAYLLTYDRRPLEARRTLERAAKRALVIGDVEC